MNNDRGESGDRRELHFNDFHVTNYILIPQKNVPNTFFQIKSSAKI